MKSAYFGLPDGITAERGRAPNGVPVVRISLPAAREDGTPETANFTYTARQLRAFALFSWDQAQQLDSGAGFPYEHEAGGA